MRDARVPAGAPVVGVLARSPRRLVCARCGHPITALDEGIAVDGAFEHERQNPAGFTHRFGCFGRAPGCVSQGVPSRQGTWFPGCFWLRQSCGGCGEHLGWLFFDAPGPREFYGLILDALVAEPGAGDEGGDPDCGEPPAAAP